MLLPGYALITSDNGIYINLYSDMTAELKSPDDVTVKIKISTDYPVTDKIAITVSPDKPTDFKVFLRIPSWSNRTLVTLNGKEIGGTAPGTYFEIKRNWSSGNIINLEPVLTARLVVLNGHQAIVRGPVVLARDTRFGNGDVDEPVVVSHKNFIVDINPSSVKPENVWMAFTVPMVLGTNLEGEYRNPRQVHLCDFASAGNTWNENSRYRVWLKQTLNVMKDDYYGY
jgi:hypothetical protein